MLAQSCGAVLGAGILWTFTFNEVATFTFYVIDCGVHHFLIRRTNHVQGSGQGLRGASGLGGTQLHQNLSPVFFSLVFLHCIKVIFQITLRYMIFLSFRLGSSRTQGISF